MSIIVMQKLDGKKKILNSIQINELEKPVYLEKGYTVHPFYDPSTDEYKKWKTDQEEMKKKKEDLEKSKKTNVDVVVMVKAGRSTQIHKKEMPHYVKQGYELHKFYQPKIVDESKKVVKKEVKEVAPIKKTD